ncbi:MAG: class I SAM-dependent methyltransferase [Planctomycetes bacterium]|nr:class I SAM-dependent methyltransferase [Planctomycetota bacterium]
MMSDPERDAWNGWNAERAPRYPHQKVVQFVFRNFDEPRRRHSSALDLGCGSGANSAFLAENGFSVVSTDLSDVGVARTRQLFRDRGLEGLQLVQRLDETDLGNAKLDLIISVGVFDCVTPDVVRRTLERLTQYLAPGCLGFFLFAHSRDFRITGRVPLLEHGYSRAEVDSLFRTFPEFEVDEYISTYQSNQIVQHEWIVTTQS